MKIVNTILFFLLFVFHSFAQNQWSVTKIPTDLQNNAHAVIRLEETFFTVKSIGEATQLNHKIITILNEEGLENASLTIFYDKLNEIENLEGVLYNALGEKVRKLKKEDIKDASAADGFSLFTDNRYKICNFKYANFPFTIEYSWSITSTNMLFYPRWFPQDDENITVEQSLLKIVMPPNLELRHKEINGMSQPTIENINGGKTYTWLARGLKTYEIEPLSPKWTHYGMGVLTAPVEFEVEGYKGNMKTWQEFGNFTNLLGKDRDVLPDDTKKDIQNLVSTITDPKEKVKKIYEYLQNKTRYVSVQLGLGGWQPFPAKDVVEKGYGDCKALSNYTKALLKSVGIEAYYATIRAGKDAANILTDFPSSQSNHVIVCVPMKTDSIWLECTSQNNPFGYLSTFTSDRYVLLATPTGGKLVHTPAYDANDNLQARNINATLDENGDAKVEATTNFTGILQDNYATIKNELNGEDQRNEFYKTINIPSFELIDYSINLEKTTTSKYIPKAIIKTSLRVKKCASKSGTRLFLMPNIMSQLTTIPPKTEKRIHQLELRNAYSETDSITYYLPKNATIEFKTEALTINSTFGNYFSDTQLKDNKLIYIRKFRRNKGLFSPTLYQEYVEFCKKVAKFDRTQLVLKL